MTKTKKIIISLVASVIVLTVISVSAIINNKNIRINNQYSQKVKQGDLLVAIGKYDDASTVYEQALKLKTTSEIKNKINSTSLIIKTSSDNFNEGMKELEAKNYLTSITYFKGVTNKYSKDYATSLDKVKQDIKLVVPSEIQQAQEFENNKDYASAVSSIFNALSVDATNKQLLDLQTKYTTEEGKAVTDEQAADDNAQTQAQATADANAKAIASTKDVTIGMTAQECMDSLWGRPVSVNKTTTASGESEQWVYGSNRYLYFDNGILTSIQN